MGKRWLATFNAAKNQFVLVACHATDVEMYESMLEEKVFFLRCWVSRVLGSGLVSGGQSLPLVGGEIFKTLV